MATYGLRPWLWGLPQNILYHRPALAFDLSLWLHFCAFVRQANKCLRGRLIIF